VGKLSSWLADVKKKKVPGQYLRRAFPSEEEMPYNERDGGFNFIGEPSLSNRVNTIILRTRKDWLIVPKAGRQIIRGK